jgi:hypothetical protein
MRLVMSWQSAVRWVGSGVLVTGLSVGLAGCLDDEPVVGPPKPSASRMVHEAFVIVDTQKCNRVTGLTTPVADANNGVNAEVFERRDLNTGVVTYDFVLDVSGERGPRAPTACASLLRCQIEAEKKMQDVARRIVNNEKAACRIAAARRDHSGGNGQP